jgi:hypothetical protein
MQPETNQQSLMKKTLLMTGMMLGACTAFVGTLTLVAMLMVGKVVASGDDGPVVVPADRVHGGAPEAPAAPARGGVNASKGHKANAPLL